MKSLTVLKTVATSLLVFGIGSTAYASHCDVQKGDTIWSIAKRYHVDFHHLKELNESLFKDLDLIYPKDEVDLPQQGHSAHESSATDSIEEGNNTIEDRGEVSQMLEILNLVNDERKKNGLGELILDHTLNGVAMEKAFDMKENNYFSHNSPKYGSPFEMLQQFGVKYESAGENIAGGQKNSKEVMQTWMNSSGHRANILNKDFTKLGVGYVEGGTYGTYWVQLFIK